MAPLQSVGRWSVGGGVARSGCNLCSGCRKLIVQLELRPDERSRKRAPLVRTASSVSKARHP